MATMNSKEFVASLLVAALAFRQKWDADVEAQSSDKLLDNTSAAVQPEEMEGQDWFEQFMRSIESSGLEGHLKHADSNHMCIAGLNKGEPAFTLRGQDVLASIFVKHWAEVASLSDDITAKKLDHAEAIAERMEEYKPQKWPD